MSHQDWTEVKWTNERMQQQQNGQRKIVQRTTGDLKAKELYDPEAIAKLKTWPKSCALNVQKLRLSLKKSQDEFARQLNVNVSVIKNLENGKGNYDGKLVSKINQTFKTNINS